MVVNAPRLLPRPPGPPVPEGWTFHAETIINPVPLGPLPVHGFSCAMRLSGFGNGQATVPAAPHVLEQERLLRLWSWRLWCYYGDQVIWCGVPTGIADDGGGYVTLTLTELPGYLAKRQWDEQAPRVFTQAEQTEIARIIAAPVQDVGVTVVTQPGPGFPRDRRYEFLEGGSRAQLLTNLAEVIGGPEFRAEYGMGPDGRPACTLRIAYPRVGGPAWLVLAVPGTAAGYRAAWDADKLRTRTFAVGELPENAPEGAMKPVAVVNAPQDGLPRLDEVDDWPGVILAATLAERAAAMAAAHAVPALDLSAASGHAAPRLGSYAVGDDVTIRLVTPLLPDGIDVPGRLTEMDISAGEGTVSWTVAVAQPPPQSRETLAARLARVDRTQKLIFRHRLAPA